MRKLLAGFIIRRVWRLARDWRAIGNPSLDTGPDPATLSTVLNVCSLICTALGVYGWFPADVGTDYICKVELWRGASEERVQEPRALMSAEAAA